MKEDRLFAWGELATFGAAVSVLADQIRGETGSSFNLADREAIARVMLRCEAGTMETAGGIVAWRHNDRPEGMRGMGDLVYKIG